MLVNQLIEFKCRKCGHLTSKRNQLRNSQFDVKVVSKSAKDDEDIDNYKLKSSDSLANSDNGLACKDMLGSLSTLSKENSDTIERRASATEIHYGETIDPEQKITRKNSVEDLKQ